MPIASNFRHGRPAFFLALAIGLALRSISNAFAPGHGWDALTSTGGNSVSGKRRSEAIVRSAVMEPPTREAPPDEDQRLDFGGQSPWAECLVEECNDESCVRVESWIFRKEHTDDYQAFMNVRNVKPQGFLPSSSAGNLKTSVTCRDREIDATLTCVECVRLILGGPYGARGVAVAAYPPQPDVVPCLGMSKLLPVTKPSSHERWDGNQEIPRQTAFCNSINAGL